MTASSTDSRRACARRTWRSRPAGVIGGPCGVATAPHTSTRAVARSRSHALVRAFGPPGLSRQTRASCDRPASLLPSSILHRSHLRTAQTPMQTGGERLESHLIWPSHCAQLLAAAYCMLRPLAHLPAAPSTHSLPLHRHALPHTHTCAPSRHCSFGHRVVVEVPSGQGRRRAHCERVSTLTQTSPSPPAHIS